MGDNTPPELSSETASSVISKFFPFTNISNDSIKSLPSYYDRNMYFEGTEEAHAGTDNGNSQYVLKISNSAMSYDIVEGLNDMMLFLRGKGFSCCSPIMSRGGTNTVLIPDREFASSAQQSQVQYPVRVFRFIPGVIMDTLDKKDLTPELFYTVGSFAGKMDLALQDFQQPAIEARLETWDLRYFANIQQFIPCLQDDKKRNLASTVLTLFETHVLPIIPSMRKGLIHNDVSGANIVLRQTGDGFELAELLDFGQCAQTCCLFEVAAMVGYAMLWKENAVEVVAPMIRGYFDELPLSSEERGCLYYAVLARLCQSAVSGEYRFTQEPWNTYVLMTPSEAWKVIELLLSTTKQHVEEIWKVYSLT